MVSPAIAVREAIIPVALVFAVILVSLITFVIGRVRQSRKKRDDDRKEKERRKREKEDKKREKETRNREKETKEKKKEQEKEKEKKTRAEKREGEKQKSKQKDKKKTKKKDETKLAENPPTSPLGMGGGGGSVGVEDARSSMNVYKLPGDREVIVNNAEQLAYTLRYHPDSPPPSGTGTIPSPITTRRGPGSGLTFFGGVPLSPTSPVSTLPSTPLLHGESESEREDISLLPGAPGEVLSFGQVGVGLATPKTPGLTTFIETEEIQTPVTPLVISSNSSSPITTAPLTGDSLDLDVIPLKILRPAQISHVFADQGWDPWIFTSPQPAQTTFVPHDEEKATLSPLNSKDIVVNSPMRVRSDLAGPEDKEIRRPRRLSEILGMEGITESLGSGLDEGDRFNPTKFGEFAHLKRNAKTFFDEGVPIKVDLSNPNASPISLNARFLRDPESPGSLRVAEGLRRGVNSAEIPQPETNEILPLGVWTEPEKKTEGNEKKKPVPITVPKVEPIILSPIKSSEKEKAEVKLDKKAAPIKQGVKTVSPGPPVTVAEDEKAKTKALREEAESEAEDIKLKDVGRQGDVKVGKEKATSKRTKKVEVGAEGEKMSEVETLSSKEKTKKKKKEKAGKIEREDIETIDPATGETIKAAEESKDEEVAPVTLQDRSVVKDRAIVDASKSDREEIEGQKIKEKKKDKKKNKVADDEPEIVEIIGPEGMKSATKSKTSEAGEEQAQRTIKVLVENPNQSQEVEGGEGKKAKKQKKKALKSEDEAGNVSGEEAEGVGPKKKSKKRKKVREEGDEGVDEGEEELIGEDGRDVAKQKTKKKNKQKIMAVAKGEEEEEESERYQGYTDLNGRARRRRIDDDDPDYSNLRIKKNKAGGYGANGRAFDLEDEDEGYYNNERARGRYDPFKDKQDMRQQQFLQDTQEHQLQRQGQELSLGYPHNTQPVQHEATNRAQREHSIRPQHGVPGSPEEKALTLEERQTLAEKRMEKLGQGSRNKKKKKRKDQEEENSSDEVGTSEVEREAPNEKKVKEPNKKIGVAGPGHILGKSGAVEGIENSEKSKEAGPQKGSEEDGISEGKDSEATKETEEREAMRRELIRERLIQKARMAPVTQKQLYKPEKPAGPNEKSREEFQANLEHRRMEPEQKSEERQTTVQEEGPVEVPATPVEGRPNEDPGSQDQSVTKPASTSAEPVTVGARREEASTASQPLIETLTDIDALPERKQPGPISVKPSQTATNNEDARVSTHHDDDMNFSDTHRKPEGPPILRDGPQTPRNVEPKINESLSRTVSDDPPLGLRPIRKDRLHHSGLQDGLESPLTTHLIDEDKPSGSDVARVRAGLAPKAPFPQHERQKEGVEKGIPTGSSKLPGHGRIDRSPEHENEDTRQSSPHNVPITSRRENLYQDASPQHSRLALPSTSDIDEDSEQSPSQKKTNPNGISIQSTTGSPAKSRPNDIAPEFEEAKSPTGRVPFKALGYTTAQATMDDDHRYSDGNALIRRQDGVNGQERVPMTAQILQPGGKPDESAALALADIVTKPPRPRRRLGEIIDVSEVTSDEDKDDLARQGNLPSSESARFDQTVAAQRESQAIEETSDERGSSVAQTKGGSIPIRLAEESQQRPERWSAQSDETVIAEQSGSERASDWESMREAVRKNPELRAQFEQRVLQRQAEWEEENGVPPNERLLNKVAGQIGAQRRAKEYRDGQSDSGYDSADPETPRKEKMIDQSGGEDGSTLTTQGEIASSRQQDGKGKGSHEDSEKLGNDSNQKQSNKLTVVGDRTGHDDGQLVSKDKVSDGPEHLENLETQAVAANVFGHEGRRHKKGGKESKQDRGGLSEAVAVGADAENDRVKRANAAEGRRNEEDKLSRRQERSLEKQQRQQSKKTGESSAGRLSHDYVDFFNSSVSLNPANLFNSSWQIVKNAPFWSVFSLITMGVYVEVSRQLYEMLVLASGASALAKRAEAAGDSTPIDLNLTRSWFSKLVKDMSFDSTAFFTLINMWSIVCIPLIGVIIHLTLESAAHPRPSRSWPRPTVGHLWHRFTDTCQSIVRVVLLDQRLYGIMTFIKKTTRWTLLRSVIFLVQLAGVILVLRQTMSLAYMAGTGLTLGPSAMPDYLLTEKAIAGIAKNIDGQGMIAIVNFVLILMVINLTAAWYALLHPKRSRFRGPKGGRGTIKWIAMIVIVAAFVGCLVYFREIASLVTKETGMSAESGDVLILGANLMCVVLVPAMGYVAYELDGVWRTHLRGQDIFKRRGCFRRAI
ncbi:hypothetical protein IAR55_005289 [Kwoniella newhampshirensis]|uniref:Uncharacterized protein n=1 Tax=Kwoniella newhampshirensis TaxID=1651941 RepID=A0AAW0YI37_9TREE